MSSTSMIELHFNVDGNPSDGADFVQPAEWNQSGFRPPRKSSADWYISYGLSSRPELLIPEGDEKRSGGTCCFVHGHQRIRKQKQKTPPRECSSTQFSVQRTDWTSKNGR